MACDVLRWFQLQAAASTDQVNDQYHQRYDQQYMYQAAGNVEAESQQPQNNKHYENSPEHMFTSYL
jgi:hypothetical protein